MPQPLALDVRTSDWGLALPAAPAMVVTVNLLHISPWECTQALMRGAARHLSADGQLLIYGPFRVDGKHVSESNQLFDNALQERNASWGVRDQDAVIAEAQTAGLSFRDIRLMPSNNRIIHFGR